MTLRFQARLLSFYFVFCFGSSFAFTPAFAQSGLSPLRPGETDYKVMALRSQQDRLGFHGRLSVYQARKPLVEITDVQWSEIPEIEAQDLKDFFKQVHEERLLVDDRLKSRRLPWLFPDSGCFARAEFMADRMEKILQRSPYKIFAFGNLMAKTKYEPSGWVKWWYHVAPIVRVGPTTYVIDPAIDSERALPVANWLRLMNATPEVSVCRPHSYDPNSDCHHETSQVQRARRDLWGFLALEMKRVLELGLNPEKYL